MKQLQQNFKIWNIERGNNSYYGNPSYFIWLEDQDGELHRAKTASNASVAYSVGSHWCDTVKTLKYHYTQNGNMIIDYLVKD